MGTKCKNKNQNRRRLQIKTPAGDILKDDNSMRILGIIKNNRDSYDTHLASVSGRVSKVLTDIRPLIKNLDLKSRREIVYSKAASLATYGIELYAGQTNWACAKLTSILMKCNQEIYNRDYFKVSNKRICKDISVDVPTEISLKATVSFIQKIIWNKKPAQIYEKLRFNSKHRGCSAI